MATDADMFECEKLFVEPSLEYELESCDKVFFTDQHVLDILFYSTTNWNKHKLHQKCLVFQFLNTSKYYLKNYIIQFAHVLF
jgi:hypothetical protein